MATLPQELIDKLKTALFSPLEEVGEDPFFRRLQQDKDEDEYVTHRPLEEQEVGEEEAPEERPEPAAATPAPEAVPGGEEEVPGEAIPGEAVPGEEVPGEIPGMGMPEEEPKTSKEIGQVYELKKIYGRLVALEQFLSGSSDPILLRLRNFISQAIELFETLISNFKSFEADRVTKVIVIYYKFLEIVYSLVRKYFELDRKENNDA